MTNKLTQADVTPENLFRQRRSLLKALGLSAATLSLPNAAQAELERWFNQSSATGDLPKNALPFVQSSRYHPDLSLTPYDKVTGYNNFYEFGLNKGDPAIHAQNFNTEGWQIRISGEVANPITIDMPTLLTKFPLEERIYRLRCVEAWSMIIPWLGFELNQLLNLAEPTQQARFVAFQTLYDPKQMPGQKRPRLGGGLHYPYVEALRLDEAMHPLTFLSVGVYGKMLPAQNGAPIRLVVPWKYGFKSIKSLVEIRLTAEQPPTTWNLAAPHEYGFYANVNPEVDHPRWSQASERIIGSGGLFSNTRQPTLPFNGYGAEVAELYQGLDLRKNY